MKFIESEIRNIDQSLNGEGAQILCRRCESDNDIVFVQWIGRTDKPVVTTLDFLRLITPEGKHFDEGLKAFPWPLRIGEAHPYIHDAVSLYRMDIQNENQN